jgi:hypothetical protein
MKALDKVKMIFKQIIKFFLCLVAHTGYTDPQFIRTKVVPVSENMLKVTWYALHHTSLFKRCPF